jgi:RNA polymerase sigma-70 factor (ECF subfamily)
MTMKPKPRTMKEPLSGGLVAAGPRARAGELERHMPRLRSVIRRILNDEQDTEDVIQDVMLTALEKLPTFRAEAALGTWLHRIAVNAALAFRRKRALRLRHVASRVDDETFDPSAATEAARQKALPPDDATVDRETKKLIQQAISQLPDLYRDVYLLADVDDLSNEDIAERLNLKLPAVKSRLHRARKMMRDQLAPHFEEQAGRADEDGEGEATKA